MTRTGAQLLDRTKAVIAKAKVSAVFTLAAGGTVTVPSTDPIYDKSRFETLHTQTVGDAGLIVAGGISFAPFNGQQVVAGGVTWTVVGFGETRWQGVSVCWQFELQRGSGASS